ncbi:DUF805 domain-containing protein [Halocynthiibacter namhaensis]|uniref:DUF805 domain-containing protein n=1 Tax=Halocynthiibacter namhaensis TaxID=1290553 RepID=UPI0005794FDA|nr:DUF805 domain-containing protein [Halocynthiibacter namhaensis]
MTFGQSVKSVYSKYVTFSGRAPRSEYWWFMLFFNIIYLGLYAVMMVVTFTLYASNPTGSPSMAPIILSSSLLTVFVLGSLLPSISVMVRRLHDVNRSGWWYWIALVPLVGIILLLVWFCTKGTDGPNDFGSDPLGGGNADVFE